MIKFPKNCNTNDNKMKFLYRALELLRLEHNEEGRKAREGTIPMKQFRNYQENSWKPKSKKIANELNQIKEIEDMFRSMPDENGKPTNPKLIEVCQLKIEGKQETKWDKDIKLETI
ncbi:MAG: hypothetical protein K940chlam5_00910 [Candidatus Anoxychlamydiales bacterium]|nr:hypothetical protein [Candidatus Anoxychlamydiales bacterium]